jgi:hypothetical protein
VFAEHDPGTRSGIAESPGERPVAIQVLEVAAGVPAEEARIVVAKVGDQYVASLRWQAALHRRADDLQHERVGDVPEYARETVQRSRELRLVLT